MATQGLNKDYVTNKVYISSQIMTTAEAKAAELTTLVQDIAAFGIFRSIDEAVAEVPSGTFVLVDASGGDLSDVVVMVVPAIF